MAIQIPNVAKGQAITADLMNAIIDKINAAINISVGNGLTITEGPGGIVISATEDSEEYEAILTEDLVRGGTANCKIVISDGSDYIETGREVEAEDRDRILTGKKLQDGDKIGIGRRGLVFIMTAYDCEDLVSAG